MKRLAIAAMLSITTGLLMCGCMAGIVTNDVTGNPVGDIEVQWGDSHGHWGQTTTDSHGLYVFDVREGAPIPVPGPVDFHLNNFYSGLVVCGAPVQERLVEYDDRPASTPPADPWEIQSFTVHCGTPTPTAATRRVAHLPTPTPTPKPGIKVR
jgi:hypothetical protein